MNITLLLLTHNESENIKRNFDWVKNMPKINEIVVVDDNSTDNTIKTVKQLSTKTLKVIVRSRGLDGDFGTQREYGLSLATNNWILWLDPDEMPDGELVKFLYDFSFSGYNYSFHRLDTFLGNILKHGETNNLSFTRLFHRKYGQFKGMVHEIWFSSKPVTKLPYKILHHPHPDLQTFYHKINVYSEIRAHELFLNKSPPHFINIIIYPLAKFFYNYFFLLGFLDGTPGTIHALGMSFHSFLVRSKLWHLYQNPSL